MSDKIKQALQILIDMGMPKGQQNDRTALCLLALLDVKEDTAWKQAKSRLISITPMMEFAKSFYQKSYAPNSRETFRRFSMHQLVDAGIALYNPDKPERPVNSPNAVYQISPLAHETIKKYGSKKYIDSIKDFQKNIGSLSEKYKSHRQMEMIPVKSISKVSLSPGEHSQLIKEIIENFAPRFIPGAILLYAGDTGSKWSFFDKKTSAKLGLEVSEHGKMPDCLFYYEPKKWLVFVEATTSHGPVDNKRRIELNELFKTTLKNIFVSAFHDKKAFIKFSSGIAWETEVWLADSPSHLIHFNGDKFLG
jgi:type II restriction enzyme